MSDRDPAVQMWQESTSARLRRVEAELGSALGALTQANAERDDMRQAAERNRDRLHHARGELAETRDVLSTAAAEVLRLRALLSGAHDANLLLIQQLAGALAANDQLAMEHAKCVLQAHQGTGQPADPDPAKENR